MTPRELEVEAELHFFLAEPMNDSRRKRFVRFLRPLSEEDQREVIERLLRIFHVTGCQVAVRCVDDREYLERLFNEGMLKSDASTIRWYLEIFAPRLGYRYVLHYVEEIRGEHPEVVEKALYWLPKVFHDDGMLSDGFYERIVALRQTVGE